MRRRRLLALLLLPAACAPVAEGSLRPPEVVLLDLRPRRLGLFTQELALRLRLANPNTADLAVRGLRLALVVDGRPLGTALSDRRFTLPALGARTVELALPVPTDALLRWLLDLLERGRFRYRLEGELLVVGGGGTVRALPFAREARFAVAEPGPPARGRAW